MAPRSDRDQLSIVIHELRNPLVGIDAAARVLARELGPHPGARRASAIASEARHLLTMLESVADAEAAAAGRLRSELRPVDLAALVRETVAGMHIDAHAVSVSAEGPVTVRADAGRIRQVLRNLLINAAQYSPIGAPIDVTVSTSGSTARVSVRDEGPGIPANERRKLFRKFTRLSTADGTPGSGLGLYICKAIVEDHGGSIAYRDDTFSFSLPLVAGGVARRAAGPRAPARVGDHPRVGRPRTTKGTAGNRKAARTEGGGTTRVERVSVRPRGATSRT